MKDETPKPPSRIKRRLVESALAISVSQPDTIAYQHTVFCQAGLPYRNPGAGVRVWERLNGLAHLKVMAGEAMCPKRQRLVEIGLPFGPKPRLILAHLNSEALRAGSPQIEVERSLTAFAKRIGGFEPNGYEVQNFKDQLGRLSTASIRLGMVHGDHAVTINSRIVVAFDLWLSRDGREPAFWPSTVCLSPEYFESLQRHAVPLDERAIAALAHSAMGLDIYVWLAQRLHRVKPGAPAFVPWMALHAQFGWNYGRMNKFKEVFRYTLRQVVGQYRNARIGVDDGGVTLCHSPPPVPLRNTLISH